MEKLVASRISGGNSAYGRSKSDFYPTPPEVTQALLDFLHLPKDTVIWEPACGEGHMVSVLEKNGMCVKKSDIQTGEDFLEVTLKDCDWIITNPPFSIADKFIRRCHEHRKPFALLLKSQYWHAAKRFDLFCDVTPSYILPLTWRPDFLFKERGNGSPLMDVMWCVWCGEICEKTIYVPLTRPMPKGGGSTPHEEDNLCMVLCGAKKTGVCSYRLRNDGTDIGKKVFLTHEDAQAALEKEKLV